MFYTAIKNKYFIKKHTQILRYGFKNLTILINLTNIKQIKRFYYLFNISMILCLIIC